MFSRSSLASYHPLRCVCVLCRLTFDFIDLFLAPANRCVHPVNFNVEYAHNLLQCSIINPGVFNESRLHSDIASCHAV